MVKYPNESFAKDVAAATISFLLSETISQGDPPPLRGNAISLYKFAEKFSFNIRVNAP
jgi:hypothetical protein